MLTPLLTPLALFYIMFVIGHHMTMCPWSNVLFLLYLPIVSILLINYYIIYPYGHNVRPCSYR